MRYGVALASLYGHPNTDLKAGSKSVNELFRLATSRIPYYNIGRQETKEEETARQLRVLKTLKRHITPEVLEAQRKYEEEHGIDHGASSIDANGLSLKRKDATVRS